MRAAVLMVLMLGAFTAAASGSSLPSGPGPRPGPAILYEPTAVAPELTNTGIWKASPILISGTTAYRGGEFLYQDYLYDDHGAHELPDPTDPRTQGDTFSKPNGTYTYPTGPGYANNAADLVEFRVKPTGSATAFRVTLNTLENPSLIAFSIALGGHPGQTFPFPDGANVVAPANLFLTVHPSGSHLVADLVHAGTDTPVRRTGLRRPRRSPAPADRGRRPPPGLEPGAEHRADGHGRRAVGRRERQVPAPPGDRRRHPPRRRRHRDQPGGVLQRRVPDGRAAALGHRRDRRGDQRRMVARSAAGHGARRG